MASESAYTGAYSFLTIGEYTYRCRMLHPLKALQLGTETARYLGSAIATMMVAASREKTDWWATAMYILQDGLTNLTPDATQTLMLRMMEAVHVGETTEHLGTEHAFNRHFQQAGLLAALEVWRWALEVNFKNFFNELRSRASRSGSGQEAPQSPSA